MSIELPNSILFMIIKLFFYGLYENDENWLVYESEVEIEMFCGMIFESYPMDEQTCHFLIGSDKYLELSGQVFSANRIRFEKSEQVALQVYRIKVNCHLPQDMKLSYVSKDDMHYQRTGFEIKFQHNFWKYLMNYYIPSGISAIFSWVSENDKTTLALR